MELARSSSLTVANFIRPPSPSSIPSSPAAATICACPLHSPTEERGHPVTTARQLLHPTFFTFVFSPPSTGALPLPPPLTIRKIPFFYIFVNGVGSWSRLPCLHLPPHVHAPHLPNLVLCQPFEALRRRRLWRRRCRGCFMICRAGARRGSAGKFTARASLGAVQFRDLYRFVVEGDVEDVNVLNEVRERVREQGRVWSALKSSNCADWYLRQPIAGKFEVHSSLNFSPRERVRQQ